MANAIRCQQGPDSPDPVDPGSSLLSRQRIQGDLSIAPSIAWDSNPYTDPSFVSSDSCESALPSPTSPSPTIYPQNKVVPKEAMKSEHAFNFDSFEDWMRWDDPNDVAATQASNLFVGIKTEPLSPIMEQLELQGSGVGSFGAGINSADECAVFGGDALPEEPLFHTPSALVSPRLIDATPKEELYSTPLSWSRPSRRARNANSYNSRVYPQQESRLREITMPPRSPSKMEYPVSPSPASSPEPCTNNRRKRKSSTSDDADNSPPGATRKGRHPPVKKTAHNMIEKRYRTNLNDKIAALRNSVPSLRVTNRKNSQGEEVEEDLQGLTPAHKLNKATVLSKATEYIAHLEKRTKYLAQENATLKARIDAYEIIMITTQQAATKQQQQHPRGSVPSIAGGPPTFSMNGMVS